VRRSILLDTRADILLYGNAERSLVEVAHRLARREPVESITDLRGTAFVRKAVPEGWIEIDSTSIDEPGPLAPPVDPYAPALDPSAMAPARPASVPGAASAPVQVVRFAR
jgi:radical SAM superfamily enzyme YgiQ (UPF0313 family)